MQLLEKIKRFAKRKPAEAIALDCSTDAVRAVRLQQAPGGITLTAADELSPVPLDAARSALGDRIELKIKELALPTPLRARYAALLAPAGSAAIKLLRFPEEVDLDDSQKVRERMGLEEGDYRIGTQVIQTSGTKREALALGVALPELLARALLDLMPKAGLPAPYSLQASELAVLNAFTSDPALADDSPPCGFIHFDHDFSIVALFNAGQISQLRTFPFGLAAVIQRIVKTLNVDQATASGVVSDGAFDISSLIEAEIREIRGQYVISRDFMERNENCRLQQVYLSGPRPLTAPFAGGEKVSVKSIHWNVLDLFDQRLAGELPDSLTDASWKLTAAIGAGMGVLSE